MNSITVGNNLTAAVVAQSDKEIRFAYKKGRTFLSKCLHEIGFHVTFLASVERFSRTPPNRLPDLLAVDVGVNEFVIDQIQDVLIQYKFPKHMTVMLYNYPDAALIKTRRFLRNTYYFGSEFTDCDLFSVATRLVKTRDESGEELPALEGKIRGDSFQEVLQFLEIGQKSGCLLIENEGPFGIMYIDKGKIVYAVNHSTRKGQDAVRDILTLKTGYFKFAINKKPSFSNCNISITHLLIEHAKDIDERTKTISIPMTIGM